MILDGVDAEEDLTGDLLIARRCGDGTRRPIRAAEGDEHPALGVGEILDLLQVGAGRSDGGGAVARCTKLDDGRAEEQNIAVDEAPALG